MLRTTKPKAASNVTKLVESQDLYTWDELPEENRKKYNTILKNFDKTVEEHIEQANAKVASTCWAIQNAYMVQIDQLPKNQRDMNFEEYSASTRPKDIRCRPCHVVLTKIENMSEIIKCRIPSQEFWQSLLEYEETTLHITKTKIVYVPRHKSD
jgi:hypothetical protein